MDGHIFVTAPLIGGLFAINGTRKGSTHNNTWIRSIHRDEVIEEISGNPRDMEIFRNNKNFFRYGPGSVDQISSVGGFIWSRDPGQTDGQIYEKI